MKIIVLKFGGTSVGSLKKIKNVARIIISYVKKYKVIVVSSAMEVLQTSFYQKPKTFQKFSRKKRINFVNRWQISCALIAGKLKDLGYKARSWLGWQIPIITRRNYSSSRIIKIHKRNIITYLTQGGIPILTGFQGIHTDYRITTLERGGSDTSAILCAKFFKADRCIIFTDVKGVYTTDPNLTKSAKKINKISYEEMLEMASLGAKVMQPASIQEARLNRIEIDVKSTFSKKGWDYNY